MSRLGFVFVASMGFLLSACMTTYDPEARARLFANTPMSEWVFPNAADVAAHADPERLRREGAALLVVAGYARAQNQIVGVGLDSFGERTPASVWLQGPTYTAMSSPDDTGPDNAWGVLVVKPGTYRFFQVAQFGHRQSLSVGRTGMGTQLASAVHDEIDVKAGDVLYVGTFVASHPRAVVNDKAPRVEIIDETDAARAFVARRLPKFASRLAVRIMPCNLCRLTELMGSR